jgi:hypothetical protein
VENPIAIGMRRSRFENLSEGDKTAELLLFAIKPVRAENDLGRPPEVVGQDPHLPAERGSISIGPNTIHTQLSSPRQVRDVDLGRRSIRSRSWWRPQGTEPAWGIASTLRRAGDLIGIPLPRDCDGAAESPVGSERGRRNAAEPLSGTFARLRSIRRRFVTVV